MLVYIEGKPYAALSITRSPIPILEVKEDYMQCIIECPYCGQRTMIGDTIMCSGFVGCPNCYFVPSGLLETVEWYRENNYDEYTLGNFYKKGFIENREDRVLKKNCKTTNVLELCKMNRRSRNMNKLIYAFDFDGTIVTNEFPEIGTPIMNVVHLIYQVKAEGHYIILNTMRENESLMRALMFCKSLGIEFDAVNDNLPHMKEFYKNNPRKIFANFYIDDHNMFVDGVNSCSDDVKELQDQVDYYKHECFAECDRAEKFEKALDKAIKALYELQPKAYNHLQTRDDLKEWCLDETK